MDNVYTVIISLDAAIARIETPRAALGLREVLPTIIPSWGGEISPSEGGDRSPIPQLIRTNTLETLGTPTDSDWVVVN